MELREYKINDYITLRLEKNGDTVIYVGGEKFLHCAFILLNISQFGRFFEAFFPVIVRLQFFHVKRNKSRANKSGDRFRFENF